ncbi:MAG: UPF0182 family protein [Actinobacteria bacterium]|nr:UPF0182 family protein [Actinomycetota bacterium]
MTDPTNAAPQARRRRLSPLAVTVVLVVLLILGFLGAASVITEVLWFDQLGYVQVLLTQWVAAGAMFLIGFFAMAVPVFFAIDIAYRKRPVYARLTAQLDRYQELVEPLRRLIKWSLPAVFGLFGGFASATSWQQVLLWVNSAPTGQTDAEFGVDISFFMFSLPFWQGVLGFASAVVLICLILGVATSYLYGGISFAGRDVRVSKATRIQAAVLAFVYLALQGVSLWLDRYAALTNYDGRFTGATYTGVHATIPGKQILAGIAVLVALLFLVTAFTGKWRLPVIGTALLLVSALVVGVGYPWAVQELRVRPDEKSLESDYLARNIEATRAAYGIDEVQIERYDAVTDAEPGQLRGDAQTTANIRIIDPEIVSPTFAQLEQSKQYYQFPESLSVDRYEIDGKIEDTVSAIRDIDISDQQGWYNQTLVYTHGYGLVASYGNQRSASGEPVFLESGIPTSGRLGEFQPRVYFGMNSPEYSIVGGERDKPIEIDYPADEAQASATAEGEAANADAPATEGEAAAGAKSDDVEADQAATVEETDGGKQNLTTFSGNGGPELGNIFTKLIYALKFQAMEIVLSGAVVDGSQILYDRNPVDRVKKVAPYLTIDSSPYASVVDGEVVWIIDGYTTSDQYPYSEMNDFNSLIVDADNPRQNPLAKPVNYIRNSVKATVNAYDGSVKLFAWDTEDPLLQAWSKVYPDTLQPVSKMSGDLLSHVRYPSDLFKVQREMLSTYHVTDAGAFYSEEDAWRTPDDPVAAAKAGANSVGDVPRQPAYYLTLAAGKDAEPNFSIYSTYIPAARGKDARNILTGYLAANSNAGNADGKVSEDYGTLKLLTLPKGNSVPGPGQVQNSFTTDDKVTGLLNILRQGDSSRVISGNLLTLPVGGGLLYVQPVYVQAASDTSFPILRKVLVSFGDQIAFEDTLDAALDDLFGGNSGASAGDGDVAPGDGGAGDGSTGAEEPAVPGGDTATPGDGSGTTSAALTQALLDMKQAIADRDDAMKAGDWAAYGEADSRLRDAITKALEAQ